MTGKRALAEITATLRPEDFYRPDHMLIYEAITELYLASKPVDILTVSDMLESKGILDKSGGLAYISSLPDLVPIVANAAHYADLVRQKSVLRRLIAAMDEVTGLCFEDGDQADLLLDIAAKRIYEIRENRDSTGFESLKDIMGRTVNELAAMAEGKVHERHVMTGFRASIVPGRIASRGLIIVAARPLWVNPLLL
jgi:replicative DNA helicase